MSSLNLIISTGLNALETENTSSVPELAPVCEVTKEVIIAAGESASAEVDVLKAVAEVESTEELVTTQEKVVVETQNVVASMESFIGTPVTKSEAMLIRNMVVGASLGMYQAEKVVGSLESFGTDVCTDDALNAGLEGLGEFIQNSVAKLGELRKVLSAKFVGFFKDAFLSIDKIDRRADAVLAMSKGTEGDSNSSTLQLPLDLAWRLTREGKVVSNLPKEVVELGKQVKLLFKDNADAMDKDRKRLVDLVTPLPNADGKQALEIARKIAAFKIPNPSFATIKVPTASTSIDIFRGAEMLGGKAIFISVPKPVDAGDSLRKGLDACINNVMRSQVETEEMTKRQAKVDCAFDTLTPAEITRLAEDVKAVLQDISSYKKSYSSWDADHKEIDRVMEVVYSVTWDGDEFEVDTDEKGFVKRNPINHMMADAIYMLNQQYNYYTVGPIYYMMAEVIPVLNRILEVCERSLATYPTNNLK
ncbi:MULTISPECIES: hypothetical protein [Proteus]|uniref:hypothetical protein n=1 Tax=Proteus TaxID=583 RepID=UPI00288AFC24|nr:hypothetical protein [Proteus columbae]